MPRRKVIQGDTVIVHSVVEKSAVEALRRIAVARGATLSSIIREAILLYLKTQPDGLLPDVALDSGAEPNHGSSQRDQLAELWARSVLEDYEEKLRVFEDMLNRYVAARASGYGYRGWGGVDAPSWSAVKQTFITLDRFTAKLVRDKMITPELLQRFLELKKRYKAAKP